MCGFSVLLASQHCCCDLWFTALSSLRLVHRLSCPYSGSRPGHSCSQCSTIPYSRAGLTTFSKVRLNITSLHIISEYLLCFLFVVFKTAPFKDNAVLFVFIQLCRKSISTLCSACAFQPQISSSAQVAVVRESPLAVQVTVTVPASARRWVTSSCGRKHVTRYLSGICVFFRVISVGVQKEWINLFCFSYGCRVASVSTWRAQD